jgi:hypothetical protein
LYRVIHPARPIAHGALYDYGWGVEVLVNKPETVDLALAWWLAARSPHSIVYLPLRSSGCDEMPAYSERKLDLVLMHHSLGFPASRWKQVRARLKPTGVQKVTLPDQPFRAIDREEHWNSLRRSDFRDHIRYDIAADTLFLVGSRFGYELESKEVVALVDRAPAELAARPDEHCCAEIDVGIWYNNSLAQRRDSPLRVHVTCCTKHW